MFAHMTTQTILAFSTVATLAILSPGPSVLLTLRNGATLGARAVVWSALGNISGVFGLSAAAILGLGVVLKSSVLLFSVVKAAGAGYLIYLGLRHLLGRAVVAPLEDDHQAAGTAAPSPARLYREAFFVAGSNPKAVLFFTALFPQYIDEKTAVLPQFLILTFLFMTISYAIHLVYALMASRARGLLRRPSFARWLNRTVGAAFVLFGSMLLVLRRRAV